MSTLIFHQGLLWIFHRIGAYPRPAYVMKPVPPFSVPAVISLVLWAELWAMALLPLIARWHDSWAYWVAWTIAGAVLPTAVAFGPSPARATARQHLLLAQPGRPPPATRPR